MALLITAAQLGAALQAHASDLLKNGKFNDRSSNWDVKATPEINCRNGLWW